ncbi:MAG TPA: ATP-binding protein [Trebonia sp.]|nr:ATP-binding protein [Trebonia sp.]
MEESPLQTEPDGPAGMWPRRDGAGSYRAWEDRHGRRHPAGGWGHRGGGPVRRDLEYRLAGGVAAGIAASRGRPDRVTAVRVVFAAAALVTWGWAIPLYFLAWLVVPAAGAEASIASKARHDSRGIALALGLASLLAVILLFAGFLNDGFVDSWGWPQVVSVGCLALIWRNAPPGEQESMRRLVEPLSGVGGVVGERTRRATVLRLAGASVLLIAGMSWLLTAHESLAMLSPLGGLVLVAAAVVLLLGPWWFRIARDLVDERQARARAEERAEVAARVHDSVLQTLALIQRRSADPAAVVQLARAQERELRSLLFEGKAPGGASSESFGDGVREIQRDVEARHEVPVEVVTVGDCPLSDDLSALLFAAREAVVNAAKWSGAPVISLFAEVSPDKTEVVVRDRGKGFDPATVPDDRKGLAESVRGRMSRHGGSVTVQSAPGEGTKVSLCMPRHQGAARGGQR